MNLALEIEKFRKIFKIKWVIFAIFAYIGTIVIYNFALLHPLIDNYSELKKRKKEIEDIYVDTKALDIDKLIGKLAYKKEYLIVKRNDIENRVVPAIEKKLVWAEIENLSEHNNLEVISFVPVAQQDEKIFDLNKQRIRMKMQGRFYDFVNMLVELEKFRYLTYVEKLQITNNVNSLGMLNIQLQLCIIVSEK